MNRIMKLLVVAIIAICSGMTAQAQQIVAFPGADGYGKNATGGRGGEVCYVTRLDDCPDNNLVEGTLRWAIRHNNGGKPRTILFNVCGTIYLTSVLKLQYPDVSILGQSAPGGGVCLAGYNMYICKDNVIVRYIRFRAGDIPNKSMTGLDMENCKNVIIDHCSMTWSMEECLTAYDTKYTTVQWCIIGEGLYNSKNAKGARAYATQWGGEHSTMWASLITNSHSRSPRFNGARDAGGNGKDTNVDSEFANNVVFNWSMTNSIYGGEMKEGVAGYNRVYMINNYYRPGPSTKSNRTEPYFAQPSTPYGEWFLDGNRFETSGTYSPWTAAAAETVNNDNTKGAKGLPDGKKLAKIPYELSGLNYKSPATMFEEVTQKAGASLPRYDEVDKRLLAEAAGKRAPKFTGTLGELGIIDSPDDIVLDSHDTYVVDGKTYNNYPYLGMQVGERYVVDTDGDGLPDTYETSIGLDPNNGADAAVAGADGYTPLENYLNGIADGSIIKVRYETSPYPTCPGKALPSKVNVNYGSVAETVSVDYGTPVTLPVSVSGVTYSVWVGNGLSYEAGKEYVFAQDIVLTPMVSVIYEYKNMLPATVAVGKTVKLPTVTKDGAEFKGWTDGTTTYAGGTSITVSTTIRLTPVFESTGFIEKVVYSTDFQNWPGTTGEGTQTFTTDETNEQLTFTYGGVSVMPQGTDAKFTAACFTPGFIRAEKNAGGFIETSALQNISTITFVHCATGSNRGWGLKVKGDGDDDWVILSKSVANPAAGQEVTVNVNRTNCQIRFYNLDEANYAFVASLVIRSKVKGEAPEQPEEEEAGNIFEDCYPYDAHVHNAAGLKLALAEAAKCPQDKRYTIFLHNGVYDLGTTAKTVVPARTSLIGESQEGVIIKNNPANANKPADDTPTLFIDQNNIDVYMQDLTVCQARDWESKQSKGQAMAIRQRAKCAVYKNVTLQGVQDTYYLNKGDASAYLENCTIAGNTDYIYGDGTVWLEQCNIQHVGNGGYITAPNTQPGYVGIVLNNCSVLADNAGFYLGRPWGDSPAATFLGTTFKTMPNEVGWAKMTDGLKIRFHEYGSVDANGTPLDLSKRSIAACNAQAGSDAPVLTADGASSYTMQNTFAKVAPAGWNPKSLTVQLSAHDVTTDGFVMRWPEVENAFGYAIVKDGKVVAFTSDPYYVADTSLGAYAVRVANAMGGLGPVSNVAKPSGIAEIAADASAESANALYNLSGQRITAPRKGQVYIYKGVKYIAK